MKKAMSYVWKIGLVLVVAGGILALIGGILGGGEEWEEVQKRGQEPILLQKFGKEICGLDVELDYGNLVVETGDVFSVSGTNGSGRQVVTTEEDGILKIREEKERGGFWKQVSFRLGSGGFGFGTFENGTELIVTVPEGAELEEVKASLGAGEMRLDGLKVSRKTEIETGAGTAVLTNFAGNGETDLSCGTGELEVTGFLNGEISVSCGTGSVLLMLGEEEKDYSFRVSCGIGEVRVGDRSYSNLGSEVKSLLPGAANELDISCGIGQVTVVFTGNEVSEIRE